MLTMTAVHVTGIVRVHVNLIDIPFTKPE